MLVNTALVKFMNLSELRNREGLWEYELDWLHRMPGGEKSP